MHAKVVHMDINNSVKEYLNNFHSSSDEFKQSVYEVFNDIGEYYQSHSEYIKANVLERIIEPDRIIKFRVTWEDDSGNIRINRGYRVQFNNTLGAYKGGLRFHQSVNESILKFLGFEQCFKNALTGLPMGGGKGGADFNPKGLSEREIMRFCHAFMIDLHKYLGPELDVPAGDINVGSKEIGYLFGQYLRITQRWEGVLTGKSPGFGGSCGRSEATGYGLVYFLEEMLRAHHLDLKGKKVIISGAGNVALHAAEKCIHEGTIVLSVSDSKGTLYFKNGMNVQDLDALKTHRLENRKPLSTFTSGEYFSGKKPWYIPADIALPCATQNELDLVDAKEMINNNIIAIAEGANMPLNHAAQDAVISAGVIYGPGKAANAGGVAVSGLERSQNATLQNWDLRSVDDQLRKIMKEIHNRTIQYIDGKNGVFNYRKGANIYGFKRLADTLIAYGVH